MKALHRAMILAEQADRASDLPAWIAKELLEEVERQAAELAELRTRPRGFQIGDGNTQTNRF